MSEESDKEFYRQRLTQALRKVPASVNAGSHQMAVSFKHWAGQAYKALSNPRTKLTTLMGLVTTYEEFKERK